MCPRPPNKRDFPDATHRTCETRCQPWCFDPAADHEIWRKTDPGRPVCGLPSVLYCDHGTDFISEHIVQVCVENRIDLVHGTVGVPRGRGKGERFFGTITTELLPTLPGYIPHGTHGAPITPPALSLSELDAAVGEFVVGDYHLRPHSESGQSPVARWTAGGWLPRMPESLEALDLLLLTVATPRKVHRDGCKWSNYVAQSGRALWRNRGSGSVRSAALQARELRQQGGNRSTTPDNSIKLRQIVRPKDQSAPDTATSDNLGARHLSL